MKTLVTGVSGRLGPYIVRELESAGHEVVLFSRRLPPESVRHLPWIEGDITCSEDCVRAVAGGFDAIHHAAAQPWPVDHPGMRERADGEEIPFDATMRANIMGVYYLLQAALRRDVPTFVMTGSNCVLGHGFRISDREFPLDYLPVDEDHPSDVEDSYSFTKLAGEQLLASYTRAYGMRTCSLRAAGICDPSRREEMRRDARPAAAWNPWLWAWVGSEDVARAHRLLMEKAEQLPPNGAFFCNGDDSSALEPTRELVAEHRPNLLPLLRQMGEHASLISNRKLRDTVGWRPETSWRDAESVGEIT